jgi:hypothetical protein
MTNHGMEISRWENDSSHNRRIQKNTVFVGPLHIRSFLDVWLLVCPYTACNFSFDLIFSEIKECAYPHSGLLATSTSPPSLSAALTFTSLSCLLRQLGDLQQKRPSLSIAH